MRRFSALVLVLCWWLTYNAAQAQGQPFLMHQGDLPDFDVMLRRMAVPPPPEALEQARQMYNQHREQMRRMRQFQPANPAMMPGLPRQELAISRSRLGVELLTPPAALVDQLDLPKNQGLLVGIVDATSEAGKAGLKEHDILLEVNDQPAPRDMGELSQTLTKLDKEAKVQLTVLRKGKKETIKNLPLVEAELDYNTRPANPVMPFPQERLAFAPPPQAFAPPMMHFQPQPGVPGAMIMIAHMGEVIHARQQAPGLSVMVMVQGKAIRQIQIQADQDSGSYDSIEKVPEQHRKKVAALLEMIEKSR